MATGDSARAVEVVNMDNAKCEKMIDPGVFDQFGCGADSEQKKNNVVNMNDLA